MSDPKLISPLLDKHAIGSAVSSHHGVACHPAMDLETQQKYIVKIISVPASQNQLDAFLLSGAYPDAASALTYFKELCDDIVMEADLLQRLSRLEGFVAYQGWQTVPKEDESGYEVYLKGEYRSTLERFMSRNPMTHLGAVNLGLDICAALSACRRSGYLYVNVKPENIFICDEREYRLGDLGFVNLSSLKYASLPEKYRSSYTAPEITDAYSALNTTLDIYALGLVMYQVYNNGTLPFTGTAPEEPLPPPPYADYEMAEIILKACDPNPENRWEDPVQMGQALVQYMQRNAVDDVPIIPPVIPMVATPAAVEATPVEEVSPVEETTEEEAVPAEEVAVEEAVPAEETIEEETAPLEETIAEEAVPAEETVEEEAVPAEETVEEEAVPAEEVAVEEAVPAEEVAVEEVAVEEVAVEETAPTEETVEEEAAPAEETIEEETAPLEETDEEEAAPAEEIAVEEAAPAEETAEEAAPAEEAAEEEPVEKLSEAEKELAFLNELLQDETAPSEESTANLDASVITNETSAMLAQADELINHTLPEPVVAPQPIEVPIPPRIQPEPVAAQTEETIEEATDQASAEDEQSAVDDADAAGFGVIHNDTQSSIVEQFTQEDEDDDDLPYPIPRKSRAGLIALLSTILILILLGLGAFFYYTNYYLQAVDGLTLLASDNRLTVLLDTTIDNNLLTVSCTDLYGNVKYAAVVDNTAVFTDLRPDSNYKVEVRIGGFHKLTGITTGTHNTSAQTTIAGFTAVTGSESGSVILNFTVQGPETTAWRVVYSAPGEAEKSLDFTGHMVTVTGLTVGKTYTFRLESASDLYIVGANTLEYTAAEIIYAQDLTPLGFYSGSLTVEWKSPIGSVVESWTVRCYNEEGYDSTVIVTGNKAIFTGLSHTSAYTVEVIAEGMSTGSRTYIPANSITFTNIQAEATSRTQLTVKWSYEGVAPAGWLVLYTADGGEPNVIQCSGSATSAVISPLIPDARYDITIQPTGGGSVFGGTYSFTTSAAPLFSGYQVNYEHMVFSMCRRPDKADWDRNDVKSSDYTNSFHSGEKASFVVKLNHEYNTSRDQIEILFVIRNSLDVPVSFNTVKRPWINMWYQGYGTLDVPVMPTAAGAYTLEIYYNGAYVTTQSFTIT